MQKEVMPTPKQSLMSESLPMYGADSEKAHLVLEQS